MEIGENRDRRWRLERIRIGDGDRRESGWEMEIGENQDTVGDGDWRESG
jgi:hypothetical protein